MARAARIEQIDERHRLVHPHEHFLRGTDVAFDEREVRLAPDAIAIGDEPEFAVHGVDVAVRDAHHERFGPAAVLNEIGNRADLRR